MTLNIPAPQSLGNGIHMIPAPLPFKSPAWVNTYAVEASDGLFLIDCGTDWEEGRQAIRAGFEFLGLAESSVHTLLVSHLHPDHVGMSTRLVREWGCRFVMHETAATRVSEYNDTPGFFRRLRQVARSHGVPDAVIAAATPEKRADYMPLIDPPDHTVADGDLIDLGNGRSLEVLHTPGHDRSHICLRDTRTGILFSGDNVLPRISPVIMYDFDGNDALGEYLEGLQRLIALEVTVTYPAHGELMGRGDERARQILLHHDRRLLDMADLVRSGETTGWQVMLKSFRPNLDALQSRLAFLETLSHLEHLTIKGRIRQQDREGRVIYLP